MLLMKKCRPIRQIDITMVGSLRKKGELLERLTGYGCCILDESHHAASDTIIKVLGEAGAKYVYGVTVTPKRGDGNTLMELR